MAIRSNQKARTRQALLDGAARVLADGTAEPSMDQIAEAAQVSRATAYRYFDSSSEVVWEVMSDRAIADVDAVMAAAGNDITDRVLAAEEAINGYLFDDPDGARAFERAALDRSLRGMAQDTDRAARRLGYIDAALEPIADRLSHSERRSVRHALALAMGSQAVPAMLDTCRLDVDEARSATRFACRTIATEASRLARAGASVTS
ncbi:TetR/AcrR family transcriptional regulator [Ilumatobacter coccineus]|uniref:Putative TetR family transcriptional regulator n=1 Tax=Ilumatobacter coccineus (strain NBRC 103263 / KCTC 29153 / YM16-304) TaxID=1313172 RepID=A0A6C7E5V6_ILUCY|nr:TetR/AcrR family transcriptional regulator [Ilumatobacter coccineus]BAN00669.1 putative TetR family transcriptional regulator [Ilumatobacter coccineus YM16-304]